MDIDTLAQETRREILDDDRGNSDDYLWSESDLESYANLALRDACKRVDLIRREFSIAVTATISTYSVDAVIRQILYAKLALADAPLDQTTELDLAINYGAGWRNTTGTPLAYVRSNRTIRLYPTPIVDDTLTVVASIIPDAGFVLDDDIDTIYQEGLKYGIAARAYDKRDSDTFSPQERDKYRALFDQFFGLPKSAKWHKTANETPLYQSMLGGRLC
jgi:hypothetical protein